MSIDFVPDDLVLVDTGDYQMLLGESVDFYDDEVNVNYD